MDYDDYRTQSLSDLEEISETFKKGVDHNTLNKIYLKQRDAELCDAIAKDIGTYMTNLPTTRMGAGLFGVQKSIGEVSYRPTNEFHFPPDRIRKLHPYGQGYYINSANDSYTCINLGRFNEIEPLPYTKRTKLDKKSGMGLFEKYYRRSAKPSSRKKRKTTIGQVEFDD